MSPLHQIAAVARSEGLPAVIADYGLRRGRQLPDELRAAPPALLDQQLPLAAVETGHHGPLRKGALVDLQLRTESRDGVEIAEECNRLVKSSLVRTSRQYQAGRCDRTSRQASTHSQHSLRSPTVHLGLFEGERKQASRGWDEDAATAAQNALAVIAIAMLLFGASLLFDRATAPAPVEPLPDIQLAQESSR